MAGPVYGWDHEFETLAYLVYVAQKFTIVKTLDLAETKISRVFPARRLLSPSRAPSPPPSGARLWTLNLRLTLAFASRSSLLDHLGRPPGSCVPHLLQKVVGIRSPCGAAAMSGIQSLLSHFLDGADFRRSLQHHAGLWRGDGWRRAGGASAGPRPGRGRRRGGRRRVAIAGWCSRSSSLPLSLAPVLLWPPFSPPHPRSGSAFCAASRYLVSRLGCFFLQSHLFFFHFSGWDLTEDYHVLLFLLCRTLSLCHVLTRVYIFTGLRLILFAQHSRREQKLWATRVLLLQLSFLLGNLW
jgi:hypothetical protein